MRHAPDSSDFVPRLLRRLPLVLAGMLVFGLVGYARAGNEPKLYRASAEALIGVSASAEQFTLAPGFFNARSLANDRALANSDAVQQGMIKRLGYLPLLSVSRPDDETDVLVFTAIGSGPELVAEAANVFVEVFGSVRTERLLASYGDAQMSTERILTGLRAQVLALPEPAIGEVSTDREELGDQIADFSEQLRGLRASSTALASGSIAILTPATTPTRPFAPLRLLPIVRSGFTGLVVCLTLCIAYLQLDDTIRNQGRLQRACASVPVLGMIPGGDFDLPTGPATESVSRLRTSIQFAALRYPIKSLQITSPNRGAGTSTIAHQLATAFFRVGTRNVLVIDGKDGSVLQDLSASPTRHADAPNGTIAELTAAGYFVIVDSPPVLTHASTLEMAQATDATLILCSDASTTVSSYGAAIKRLELVQATIAGAVLNISKPHHSDRSVWPRGAGRAGRLLH